MLASTSRIRLTSSMRATLRRVVRPLLSRAAQSRATPAFLLDLTVIEPESVVPPTTRRCIGPDTPERDDPGVECFADPGQHVEGQVLVAPLDPVDGALAGAERVGELDLGQLAVLASVADEVADPAQVVVRHPARISHI